MMFTRPEILEDEEDVLSYSTVTDTDSFFAVPFISITDSYEVINQNVTINKKDDEDE